MINVYDWFESFAVVLENQRRELVSGEEESAPPTKKGKERTKQDKSTREETVEDQGMWDMEVHARFIRAVHELDFIGLIKHTSRKADHVIKTIFDVLD
jgi:origin recognition complex subunit 3